MPVKKLNIYLLKQNYPFEDYLKLEQSSYTVTKHIVDKRKLGPPVNGGQIFLLSKTHKPNWEDLIQEIAKKKRVKIPSNVEQKGIVFLRIRSSLFSRHFIFALTFGNSHHQLDSALIIKDFAIKVAKSLLPPDKIAAIDSIAIDRKIYNTRKQAASHILPDKILSTGEYSIIKKIYGKGKLSHVLNAANINLEVQVGGETGLNLAGDFEFAGDLASILEKLLEIYINHTSQDQLFKVPETIKKIQDHSVKAELNKHLGEKILKILNMPSIDKRNLKGITIQPQKIFDLETFNGFFITGLGYKSKKNAGDFEIDEVNYFERLKRTHAAQLATLTEEEIISKLNTSIIKIKLTTNQSEKLCSVYEALSVDMTFKKDKYLLVDGNWYKIDRGFYALLKKEIDAIPIQAPNDKNQINFLPFDIAIHTDPSGKKREGLYNEYCAKQNRILMLDRTKYTPGAEFLRNLQLKTNSNIELSDLFTYNNDVVHFVHVKRHSGGASGTSHLLSQAVVSAQLYNEDTQNTVQFIDKQITEHNQKTPPPDHSFLPFQHNNQEKRITLAIIDKNAFTSASKNKKNSAVFTLLEMISIRENLRILNNLGYKCYLKFINSNEP